MTILTRELAGLSQGLCDKHCSKSRLGGGTGEGMRVIVPLLLSLAMWAFILLGLAGLWLKIFGR